MNGDTIPSLIRTWVPLAVAWLVGFLASLGIQVDSGTQAALASAIGAIVAGAYYAAVRWAEQRWPWVGRFLGSTKQPVYADMHIARVKGDPNGPAS
ncbi:hypothetical protein [Nakamurella lactea]|uniref:hypothetical protein n=1 Tax=Nakamurella lactea TaxID=459515 RepID=UPI00042321A0|nr:hypothetical protein [Nakamurella lactea]